MRVELPRLLTAPPDVLSPRMVRVIEDLAGDWRRLDQRIEALSAEIEAIARRDAGCQRLMSVPVFRCWPEKFAAPLLGDAAAHCDIARLLCEDHLSAAPKQSAPPSKLRLIDTLSVRSAPQLLRRSNGRRVHGRAPCAPSTPAPIVMAETTSTAACRYVARLKARSLLSSASLRKRSCTNSGSRQHDAVFVI